MSGDPRSAASARAPRASVPPTRSRPGASRLVPGLIILGAGGACLLAGLDAVLLRPGARAPVDDAELVAFHGPLVLVGLLGTVVALERAMAARADWALLAPAGSATGWLALVAGVPGPAGCWRSWAPWSCARSTCASTGAPPPSPWISGPWAPSP